MESLWGKRFLALFIDAVVVSLILWILSALIYPLIAITGTYGVLNYWFILAAILIIGYFTYLEGNYNTTIGKNIVKIKVIADNGEMNYETAFKRNLSKILWLPLIVDIIVGYASGDSKSRYLDKFAGTNVVSVKFEQKKATAESDTPKSTSK
ncbi:MAG: RDD family protein [Methanobacterium sp.]